MTRLPQIPRSAWWWLAAVIAAWFVQRGLNTLAAGAGARQKAIDRETAAFGLN